MALEARHALWDHYFHRPYSGRRLLPPLLAVDVMWGRLLASEAERKALKKHPLSNWK
jgi:hypothetical protein